MPAVGVTICCTEGTSYAIASGLRPLDARAESLFLHDGLGL